MGCHQAAKYYIEHKSLIFRATESRFCMEVRMKNVKLSSSCCQAVIKLSSNTKIQKYKNTQNTQNTQNTKNNSPAPAINIQKEKNMQKEQQNIKFYFRASY